MTVVSPFPGKAVVFHLSGDAAEQVETPSQKETTSTQAYTQKNDGTSASSLDLSAADSSNASASSLAQLCHSTGQIGQGALPVQAGSRQVWESLWPSY
ncbi:hypothetical protein MGYG_00099 [Nannizzia gypsea CBS 118893]|uniref:Uncharacterized protein n=1 Tax=Arthroderma gypseum (strain ATCC MYA-4604 / CBS 118893) TaxID=535722 RepID=E5R2S2_ARTGP|nr:hypothetical protein MGYG_00099 [Nannizzia gypsea CBS 118893]EFQ97056.1 hypothetical protein MGYG_00099 [Nannizzia gypsea CBS 118893]